MNLPLYVLNASRKAESHARWTAEAFTEFEEAIAQLINESSSSRVGKTISAATASKVQSVLDQLATAEEAYAQAKKALGVLIDLAGGDPDDAPNMGESGMTLKDKQLHQSEIGSSRHRQTLGDSVRNRPGELPVPPWHR